MPFTTFLTTSLVHDEVWLKLLLCDKVCHLYLKRTQTFFYQSTPVQCSRIPISRHPWQVDLGHGKVDFQTSVVRGQVDFILAKSNFQKPLVHKIQMSCTNWVSMFYFNHVLQKRSLSILCYYRGLKNACKLKRLYDSAKKKVKPDRKRWRDQDPDLKFVSFAWNVWRFHHHHHILCK